MSNPIEKSVFKTAMPIAPAPVKDGLFDLALSVTTLSGKQVAAAVVKKVKEYISPQPSAEELRRYEEVARRNEYLVQQFNLQRIGEGKTLPEKTSDRDDVKWLMRSSQSRRSIFQ